jgi:putative Ca2+/H+ antiporter (TMEM165/GDT1 family)
VPVDLVHLWESKKGEMNVEKQLTTAAYWLGILCAIIALVTRLCAMVGVFVFHATEGKIPLSYRTFLDGAILFFMMAIASSVVTWVKAQRS